MHAAATAPQCHNGTGTTMATSRSDTKCTIYDIGNWDEWQLSVNDALLKGKVVGPQGRASSVRLMRGVCS